MNYQNCLSFLYEQLPMYQRDGSIAFKKDLTNIVALCHYLGNPQEKYRIIHVAGTNGKGSVCHMLAAILQSAGFKVGLYTSPHYYDFRERIKINGELIGEQDVVEVLHSLMPEVEHIQPSFFELTVAMAFQYFASENVDFAIIETGLGGRLDSTNIVTPLLSVVTNISYDHQAMLGATLPLIAKEKAGVIKPGTPVLIGERGHETDFVFEQAATDKLAPISFAEDMVVLKNPKVVDEGFELLVTIPRDKVSFEMILGLAGRYQLNNLQTTLASIIMLYEYHNISIPVKSIKEGLAKIVVLTGMQGRWQTLQREPLMIADSGHNVVGLELAMRQLSEFSDRLVHLIFGVVKDKSYCDMLDLLPKTATFYWCAAALPRALDAHTLMLEGRKRKLQGDAYNSVAAAVEAALQRSKKSDVIYIGGSSFVVGEVLALMTPPVALD